MEAVYALLASLFLAASVYLLLSRIVIRMLVGLVLLGNAVNLTLFTAGRLTRAVPPVIDPSGEILSSQAANPLPQALILTAIVISFSLFAFLLVLAWRTSAALSTGDTDRMRLAEPVQPERPEGGY